MAPHPLNKTFMGEMPLGYEGEFGPGVKAYILSSHYESNMTEPAIVNTLRTHGIFISACTVSRILMENIQEYHKEKQEIVKEGSKKFDKLFSERTGYDELDKRIELTRLRKNSLLLVLQYPVLPLHNNTSELGARGQARKRDISLHTMSKKGTEAKDTFMTITETAKKHGVNIYHYLYNRITQKYEMPSLANLIKLACVPDLKSARSCSLTQRLLEK